MPGDLKTGRPGDGELHTFPILYCLSDGFRLPHQVPDPLDQIDQYGNNGKDKDDQQSRPDPFIVVAVADVQRVDDIDHDQGEGAGYIGNRLQQVLEPFVIVKDKKDIGPYVNVYG